MGTFFLLLVGQCLFLCANSTDGHSGLMRLIWVIFPSRSFHGRDDGALSSTQSVRLLLCPAGLSGLSDWLQWTLVAYFNEGQSTALPLLWGPARTKSSNVQTRLSLSSLEIHLHAGTSPLSFALPCWEGMLRT